MFDLLSLSRFTLLEMRLGSRDDIVITFGVLDLLSSKILLTTEKNLLTANIISCLQYFRFVTIFDMFN